MSWIAFAVGLVCLAFCAFGWSVSPREFFIAYLFAELVWLGVALGCTAFLMIHYLTGGKWGWPVRRFFEAAAATLPLLGLFFVPICFGLGFLYPWTSLVNVAADKVLRHKQAYLNGPLFVVRAAFVFGLWSLLAHLVNKWSREQDTMRSLKPLKKLRKLSGPGLVIYPLTIAVAYVDWVMSLEADWYSTIF